MTAALCSSIRSAGTAAINMCLVASGCVEAYYEMGMHVWDLAAASLVVTEAGGVLMDVEGKAAGARPQAGGLTPPICRLSSGGPFDLMSRRVIAANNRSIGERLVREIQAYAPARDDAPAPRS